MFRQRIILGGILLAFFFICVRLFYWQIVRGGTLSEAAAQQYYFTLTLPAERGEIRASDDNPIVANQTAYLVYAKPKEITDVSQFSQKVSEFINLTPEAIKERVSQPNLVWSLLKHKVDAEVRDKLLGAELPGLGFEPEGKRYYPEASMAAHLLGFVGSEASGDDKGYFGLEGFYDRALRGKSGSLIQEKDARGLPILIAGDRRTPAENGQILELYLDRTVQFIIEEKLKEGIEKYGAKSGTVAVMDPKTGGILGMVAWPAYDPRNFNDFDPAIYPNPIVAETYEPGSTFKVMVMATALSEKTVTPTTKYNEEGPIKVDDYLIRTWNDQYHGEITATEILEKSSNPGMVFVQKSLGRDKFISYLKKFGFGEKTGIDLEEETSPSLRPDSEWKDIDMATASFGQGIAVTPIQMLRAVGALANDGNLMEPHVVRKLIDTTGKIIEVKPKKYSLVIRPAAAKTITEMMISAVDKGEAKWAKPAGYRIAGKTGTAQIPVAGHYDDKKTIASFVGFAPADQPKFVMLVTLREPTTSPWGSETAAPLFFAITKELFNYYGISPKD